MSSEPTPLYPQAVALPLFAFPAWILCIPPLVWQFRQGNIATGSLVLWVLMENFFLSINALIWPRDNINEWWNGDVWCDINIRIQVGAIVGTTGSAIMIVRKLAKVMDTRNISVSSSRHTMLREKILEVVCCWVYPLVLIIVYYVVQPIRYMIFGIVGCISSFDTSWVSIVLFYMWAPLTTLVGAGYAILLSYRLYRYRRDFDRLIAARNTTKARFVRLFVLCAIIIFGNVPYTLYLLFYRVASKAFNDSYDWNRVHDPVRLKTIMKIPSLGNIMIDVWGVVATGYLVFFIFGTGNDAKRLYKSTMVSFGLDKVFPSLHSVRDSGSRTPASFITLRSWSSSLSSKAKKIFNSQIGTLTESTLGSSNRDSTMILSDVYQLEPLTTDEPVLKRNDKADVAVASPPRQSFFQRILHYRGSSILPLFSRPSSTQIDATSSQEGSSRLWSARAWASKKSSSSQSSDTDAVQIVKEVHQDFQKPSDHKNARFSANEWA